MSAHDSNFRESALQLISVNVDGKYVLHPDGISFLCNVPKPIAVISVAGLYRTGKSYLLNRILLNRSGGFGVGPTVNPCTKGLWCWGAPIKGTTAEGEKMNVIIIDTEGIGALDEDQNHDAKIFTLAVLSASAFIYNSVGSIDENALQNLSLIVNLTKHIQLSSHRSQEDQEDDPEELAEYFPSFFWVVRDFSLQLISSEGETISSKEYLERALAPQKGFSDDVEQKNRIRRLLSAFFRERQCYTLVRPLVNEQKLQNLEKCNLDDLRPQFVEQSLNLRRRVLSRMRPKTLRGECLDGPMYVSLLQSYVNAINTGGVPNIQNAWNYMCAQKYTRLQENCFNIFNQEMELLEGRLPCSEKYFNEVVTAAEQASLEAFEAEQIGVESRVFLKELREQLQMRIDKFRNDNQREAIAVLRSYAYKQFGSIEKRMKVGEYPTFQDFVKSINTFYASLIDSGPDLPKKELVYLDFLKKAIPQGAEVFLRGMQDSHNRQVAELDDRRVTLQTELQQLAKEMTLRQVASQQKTKQLEYQNAQLILRTEENQQQIRLLKGAIESQALKNQTTLRTKSEKFEKCIEELTAQVDKQIQKRSIVEASLALNRQNYQKEKALTELKCKQLREQIDMLRVKEKNNQIMNQTLKQEHATEIKEIQLNHETRMAKIMAQLNDLKETVVDLQEERGKLTMKVEEKQREEAVNSRKYLEELELKNEKMIEAEQEAEHLLKTELGKAESEKLQLEQSLKVMRERVLGLEKESKDISERMKTVSAGYEKEVAVLSQRVEFLIQEDKQNKQQLVSKCQSYENTIKSMEHMHASELNKATVERDQKMNEMQTDKIRDLLRQLEMSKYNHSKEIEQVINQAQNEKFKHSMELTRINSQLNLQRTLAADYERQVGSLYTTLEEKQESGSQEIRTKEAQWNARIKELQNELDTLQEKLSEEQTEHHNRSEESIRQLKNYYELEKEKLESKLASDKERYEKKLQEVVREYEARLQEETTVQEEEFEAMQENFANEIGQLKEIINSLQHDVDIKAKAAENSERRLAEEKNKFQRKETDYIMKIQRLQDTNNSERQNLQNKISELQSIRSKMEKELINCTHLKEQLAKELREKDILCESKSEELLTIGKALERAVSDQRSKTNELNSEYMQAKINYEKKIALCEQEKEFCLRKLEDNEKEMSLMSQQFEDKNRKLREEFTKQLHELQDRKNQELLLFQGKHEKLKRSSKESEQRSTRMIDDLEKELAGQRQRFVQLQQRLKESEQRKSTEGECTSNQLTATRSTFAKFKKETEQIEESLKSQIAQMESEKQQLQTVHERERILWQNKNTFLQDARDKAKKQGIESIKRLQASVDSLQKARLAQKSLHEQTVAELVSKSDKKYWASLQQINENHTKKQNELESNIKRLEGQVRSYSERLAMEIQSRQELTSSSERRIKQLQEAERRAVSELERVRNSKEAVNSENISAWEKQRESLKLKLQEKQEKYKNVVDQKQLLYFELEKEKAKWNIEKQNFAVKNQSLRDLLNKHERDMEKLQRENQKLKVERKCSKFAPNYSRHSIERGSSRSSFQDSQSTLNISMLNKEGNKSFFSKDSTTDLGKESHHPLSEISLFTNQ